MTLKVIQRHIDRRGVGALIIRASNKGTTCRVLNEFIDACVFAVHKLVLFRPARRGVRDVGRPD